MSSSNRIATGELSRPDFVSIPRYTAGDGDAFDLSDNTNQWEYLPRPPRRCGRAWMYRAIPICTVSRSSKQLRKWQA